MKRTNLIIFTMLTIFLLSGCAGKEKGSADKPVSAAEDQETAEASAEAGTESSEGSEEINEASEDLETETNDIDTGVDYPFQERFVYGNKNLFYIEDDGSLTCEFRGAEDQTIEYGAGDPDTYFFIVNGKDGQTVYFLDRSMQLSFTPISYPEDMYVNTISCYKGMLYYYGYDRQNEKYASYYYDPEGDAFNNDPEIDKLTYRLENYKGRDLDRLTYASDIVREISTTGNIYMKEGSTGEIYVFDDAGNEIRTIQGDERDGETKYYGTGYLLQKINYYGQDKPKDTGQEYVLYDVRSGEKYDFSVGHDPDDVFVADLRDGYVYYSEGVRKDGVLTGRDYRRISVDSIRKGASDSEDIVHIDLYPNVDSNYGSYTEGNSGYDGFCVKDDRAFYLVFDEKGEDGRKGDVVWRSIPLEGSPDRNVQKTGAMERHEEFSDYGYLTAESDIKVADNTDGFKYFIGNYQSFRFNDDFENADKLNKALEEIDKGFRSRGDEIAVTAYNEIIENGEEGNNVEWFQEFIGNGYTYDQTFGGVQKIGKNHILISYDDYEYYGGAHGTGSSHNYFFDKNTGQRQTIKDLFKGTAEEFEKIAFDASVNTWKNDGSNYYFEFDGDENSDDTAKMKEYFRQSISIDMNMRFSEEGVYIIYAPYAVGPYASGEIEVLIPWYMLDISDTDI